MISFMGQWPFKINRKNIVTISKVVPETLDFVVFEQVFLRWMKVFTCYPWTQYVNWMYNACSPEVLFSKEIKQTWYEVFKYAYLIGLTYSQKICWYKLMFRNVITWYEVYKIDQLHPYKHDRPMLWIKTFYHHPNTKHLFKVNNKDTGISHFDVILVFLSLLWTGICSVGQLLSQKCHSTKISKHVHESMTRIFL